MGGCLSGFLLWAGAAIGAGFAIAVWNAVYGAGILVEAHLANVDEVKVGELDADRSLAEKIWFGLLLLPGAALVVLAFPGRDPKAWIALAIAFVLLGIAAGVIEYLRYVVKWRGVLFLAKDLAAWLGALLAGLALLLVVAAIASSCWEAVKKAVP